LGIWKLQLYSTTQTQALPRLADGQIIIDGTTQPGGRPSGPKIIIVGPGTGQKNGLLVGDVAGDNSNEIRGLGFQNFKDHLTINTDYNVIENNWFGLNDDGTAPHLRNGNPQDGSGSSGVAISAGADHNTIRSNVFLGLDGVAAAIRDAANRFASNLVGTTPDGRVPGKQTDPTPSTGRRGEPVEPSGQGLICTPVDWLGGGGISVDGQDHVIENNVFAGLRQEISGTPSTGRRGEPVEPSGQALDPAGRDCFDRLNTSRAAGSRHVIRPLTGIFDNNRIGVDGVGTEVGVCGRGIERCAYLISSPQSMQVSTNTIPSLHSGQASRPA
jgi:hypothetical protein